MYRIIENGIQRIADGANIPADPFNSDYAGYLDWVRAGNLAEVTPTRDEAVAAGLALVSATNPSTARDGLVSAIERHVDSVAREREFDNAADAASYVNSTVAQWAAEAAAFVAWRDAVWIHTYAELEKVEAGQRAPTVAALTAELSSIAWPA